MRPRPSSNKLYVYAESNAKTRSAPTNQSDSGQWSSCPFPNHKPQRPRKGKHESLFPRSGTLFRPGRFHGEPYFHAGGYLYFGRGGSTIEPGRCGPHYALNCTIVKADRPKDTHQGPETSKKQNYGMSTATSWDMTIDVAAICTLGGRKRKTQTISEKNMQIEPLVLC